ncbi:hypothetical protein CLIB1423_01S04918 [[Candida] railenensis]|uniref:Uncharacterized protein n=1 Tax=[Candida] railenensis TaxID=45579 RepID=A0A9P0QKS0_9ASCO|nr:hypothetical protein CLIB1423_01S04918 [[Candida] railenensis]
MPASNLEFYLIKAYICPSLDSALEFFRDLANTVLRVVKDIPEPEFYFLLYNNNTMGEDVDLNYQDIFVQLDKCDSRLRTINVQLTRSKSQILQDLPNFMEMKQILIETFKKFISPAVSESIESFEQILHKLVIRPNNVSKYVAFFTNSSIDLRLIYEKLSALISELDKTDSNLTEVLSESIRFSDFLVGSKTYQENSPLYQEYERRVRNSQNQELLEYPEYLLELDFVQLNLYDESYKSATCTKMNKNLLSLYHIAYLSLRMLDEQDDLCFGITVHLKNSCKSSVNVPYLEDLITIIRGFMVTNSDKSYYIIGELLIMRSNDYSVIPNLKRRINYMRGNFMQHYQLYTVFRRVFQLVCKKSDTNGWNTFSSFGDYFDDFFKHFKSLVELLDHDQGNHDNKTFEKFFNNDVKTMELYREIKKLTVLSNKMSSIFCSKVSDELFMKR